MEKQAVITATDLCIGYRTHKEEKKVHEHLSFELYPGELTSPFGANGAGKSTLLRTLSASQPSLAGDLQLLDKPLQHYSEKERSRTIGVVLTDKTQAGGLTVYELQCAENRSVWYCADRSNVVRKACGSYQNTSVRSVLGE